MLASRSCCQPEMPLGRRFDTPVEQPSAPTLSGPPASSEGQRLQFALEAAQRARNSEQRFQQAMEATHDALWDWNAVTNECYFSPSYFRMLGFAPGDFDSTLAAWQARVHPDDLERTLQANMDCVEGRTESFTIEYRLQARDGDWRWVLGRGKAIARDAAGRATRLIGTHVDVTDRRRQEDRLQERTRQLDLLARISQLLILEQHSEGELLSTVFGELAGAIGAEMYFNYRPHDTESMKLCNWGGLSADERTLFETMRYGERLCGRVAERRRRIVVEDIPHTDAEGSEAVRAAGYGAYAGFPLLSGDRFLGTVAFITRNKTHFEDGEVSMLQTAVDQVAATLGRLQLMQELQASDERLRLAQRAANLGIFDIDRRTGRLRWDARVRELWGVGPDEAVTNDTFLAGLHPDDLASIDQAVQAALDPDGDGRFTAQYRVIHRVDRRERWIDASGQATFSGGEAVRLVGTVADITARMTAERRMATIRDALSATPVSPVNLVTLGETREIERAPASTAMRLAAMRAASLLDASPEPGFDQITRLAAGVLEAPVSMFTVVDAERQFFVGAYGLPLLPDHERGQPPPAAYCRYTIESEAPVSIHDARHNPLVADTGAWQHGFVAYLGVPIRDRDGTVVAALGVADSRPRAWTQRDLRTLQGIGRLLRHELERRAILRDLAASEARLRDADWRKDEFLAMLAHELRNPLAPIRNAATLLARLLGDDTQVRSLLAMIDRQTSQLTHLVDDLLDVSRIAQGRIELNLELLEVGAILQQAVEAVQALMTEKRHQLQVHRPAAKLYVHGDRVRLVQALSNLLHNAAKYTESGGSIELTVRAVDETLDLEVRDDGVGIPSELLPHVFDLFVQSERTLDRSQGGLGIGLSVVKRLIEMHQGAVEACSHGPGKGSTFTIHLRRAAAPQPAHPPTPPPAPVRPRRILVVDDNVDAADSLATLLKLDGHEVEAVYGAVAALAAIDAHEPDVVLLDIGMPQMDGYEVARRIRGRSAIRRMRLVALTGYGQDADLTRAEAAGFDAHLVKPADPDALAGVLKAPAPGDPRP